MDGPDPDSRRAALRRPGILRRHVLHRNTELVVFEDCSHAAIYENVEAFNARTLAFLQRHSR